MQKKDIQMIVRSVTTRYLGVWPAHLNEITDLVTNAQSGDDLVILVDQIGYGHYSRPEDYSQYLSELEEARKRKVKVVMLVYPEDEARRSLERQFSQTDFEPLSEGLKEKLKKYQGYYQRIIHSVPETYEAFLTAALCIQSSFCTRLTQVVAEVDPIEVRTINNPLPEETFFWLIRREDAMKRMIFAYPRFGGGKTGHAFITQEPKLLEIFSNHFKQESAAERSTPVVPGTLLFPKACAKLSAQQTAKAAGA